MDTIETNTHMKNKQTQYGIFYRSNGRWTTTPYAGATFTWRTMTRNPIRKDIMMLKNYILKSRVKILPVTMA
jgi:hypothetical protein